MTLRRMGWAGEAALLAALSMVPQIVPASLMFPAIQALIAVLFVLSYAHLMRSGMMSFGHAAYFGVGAFATIHLMQWAERGLPFPTVLLPVGGGIAGLAAGVVGGFFATKRTGVYFAMITIAIAEAMHAMAPNWDAVFGGETGLSSVRTPWMGVSFGTDTQVYYLVAFWAVLSAGLLRASTQTPFGRLSLAIKDNGQRVMMLGYNTDLVRLIVFSVAAMFAGIAGSLFALSMESVSYTVFQLDVSASVVLQTVIGGMALFYGPAVGALLLVLMGYFVSDMTRFWPLYQGLLFIAIVMFMPRGLSGLPADVWSAGRWGIRAMRRVRGAVSRGLPHA